ncbi:hypothetical protein NHG35_06675 [Aerococcaceae bacterium NML180378]|nr:hypothetical protein [Aerococcaceae bacterium NML180378]
MNQNLVVAILIVTPIVILFALSGNFTGIKEVTDFLNFLHSKPVIEQVLFLIWIIIGLWSAFNLSEFNLFQGLFLRPEFWLLLKVMLFIIFFMLGIFLVPIQYTIAFIKRGG